MNKKQQGGVSLFVVIFAALLFSVIALSFVSIMTRERERSSDAEMAQSAYDSAVSGVEDAKRVIVDCQNPSSPIQPKCATLIGPSSPCDSISQSRYGGENVTGDSETVIQSSGNTGKEFEQAYTCVKINDVSPDYVARVEEGASVSVPLKSESDFNQVKIEWQRRDIDTTISFNGSCPSDASNVGVLCSDAQWNNMPALMRAQFILPNASFRLGDLDQNNTTSTHFLRPVNGAVATPASANGTRYVETNNGAGANTPDAAGCDMTLASYVCGRMISMPKNVTAASSQVSLLRLKPMYRAADVRVTLYKDGAPVNFKGAQILVDSTGRTGDVFKRVEARLAPSLDGSIVAPEYAVDLEGSLCKNFSVIDKAEDGFPRAEGGTCQP